MMREHPFLCHWYPPDDLDSYEYILTYLTGSPNRIVLNYIFLWCHLILDIIPIVTSLHKSMFPPTCLLIYKESSHRA